MTGKKIEGSKSKSKEKVSKKKQYNKNAKKLVWNPETDLFRNIYYSNNSIVEKFQSILKLFEEQIIEHRKQYMEKTQTKKSPNNIDYFLFQLSYNDAWFLNYVLFNFPVLIQIISKNRISKKNNIIGKKYKLAITGYKYGAKLDSPRFLGLLVYNTDNRKHFLENFKGTILYDPMEEYNITFNKKTPGEGVVFIKNEYIRYEFKNENDKLAYLIYTRISAYLARLPEKPYSNNYIRS